MFNKFTSRNIDIGIKWLTGKIKSFFKLKNRHTNPACKTYKDVCSCDEKMDIGETV